MLPTIGNISVSLASAANPTGSPTGIDLIGIRNSDFVATGTGATNGNLGNITVTSTDISQPVFTLHAIRNSEAVRDQIRHYVEDCRTKKRVRAIDVE